MGRAGCGWFLRQPGAAAFSLVPPIVLLSGVTRWFLMVDTLSWSLGVDALPVALVVAVLARSSPGCFVACIACILLLVAPFSHPLCTDVDVEALMRSTLDATREFDAFLVSLVHEAPPEAIALRQVCGSQRDAPMKEGSCVVVLKCVRQRRQGRRQGFCDRYPRSLFFFNHFACTRTLRVCLTAWHAPR